MSSRGQTCPLCDSHSFHSQLMLPSPKIKFFHVIGILLSQKYLGFIYWHISKVRVEIFIWLQGKAVWGSSLFLTKTVVGILDIYVYISLNRVKAPKAIALCHWKQKQSWLASVTRGAQSKHKINMFLKEVISQGDFNILQIQILRGSGINTSLKTKMHLFQWHSFKERRVLTSLHLGAQSQNRVMFFPVKSAVW